MTDLNRRSFFQRIGAMFVVAAAAEALPAPKPKPTPTLSGVEIQRQYSDYHLPFLFKVIDAGHEFVIHEDGRIEGFGRGALVINYIDCLIAKVQLSPRNPLQSGIIVEDGNGA